MWVWSRMPFLAGCRTGAGRIFSPIIGTLQLDTGWPRELRKASQKPRPFLTAPNRKAMATGVAKAAAEAVGGALRPPFQVGKRQIFL